MGLKHELMLTSPLNDVMAKCIKSLSNKKQKLKTECGLVNIYSICRAKGTNGKDIVPS